MCRFLILMLVLTGMAVPAMGQQEVEEYYPTGTRAIEEYCSDKDNGGTHIIHECFRRYTVGKDTIIDGKLYKELIAEEYGTDHKISYRDIQESDWVRETYVLNFIRQEGTKVYRMQRIPNHDYQADDERYWTSKEELRYDFDWEIGSMLSPTNRVIDSIEKITLIDGKTYDYVDFLSDRDSFLDANFGRQPYQIRTIGNVADLYGGIFDNWFTLTWCDCVQHGYVNSFERNGVVIYTSEDNGFTTAIATPQTESTGSGRAYDLSGRPVSGSHRGVTISNGRSQLQNRR